MTICHCYHSSHLRLLVSHEEPPIWICLHVLVVPPHRFRATLNVMSWLRRLSDSSLSALYGFLSGSTAQGSVSEDQPKALRLVPSNRLSTTASDAYKNIRRSTRFDVSRTTEHGGQGLAGWLGLMESASSS